MDREEMVKTTIEDRGVKDPLVLAAMRKALREEFVPAHQKKYAYTDEPLQIGEKQTISQPYIVAFMTELLRIDNSAERILEIGTGSGYQAAVLAEIARKVYTVEIIEQLHSRAKETFERLGYKNIYLKCSDGYSGWKEHAPYDGIIVTAAPKRIPELLIEQLKTGARLVLPVGDSCQELVVIIKTGNGYTREDSIGVRFVPMTGKIEEEGETER